MANLIQELIQKAAQNPKRVALPECEAEKTLLAARAVLDSGIGMPVLGNDPAVIRVWRLWTSPTRPAGPIWPPASPRKR